MCKVQIPASRCVEEDPARGIFVRDLACRYAACVAQLLGDAWPSINLISINKATEQKSECVGLYY